MIDIGIRRRSSVNTCQGSRWHVPLCHLPVAPAHWVLLVVLTLTPQIMHAQRFSAYEGHHRPLLIFAPGPDDERLRQMHQLLQQHHCELDDRAMVIAVALATGRSTLNGALMKAEDSSQLRQRYAIQADQFSLVLIGKDGREKYRSDRPADPTELFTLVDAMPMRIREMKKNPAACAPTAH